MTARLRLGLGASGLFPTMELIQGDTESSQEHLWVKISLAFILKIHLSFWSRMLFLGKKGFLAVYCILSCSIPEK